MEQTGRKQAEDGEDKKCGKRYQCKENRKRKQRIRELLKNELTKGKFFQRYPNLQKEDHSMDRNERGARFVMN